jgi:glyoxylase-like metal-dependent hydrolase (beta-lactamase superfamily II)
MTDEADAPAIVVGAMQMRFCDDLGPYGFSWITDEAMTRTSHALVQNTRVWLVDPLDWPEALARAGSLGRPEAVVQLLDRHDRDCAEVAARLGIPHLMVPRSLPGTPFEVIEIRRGRFWQEIAVWWREARVLLTADALGTNAFFTVGDDRIGVHGLLKPTPPRRLARLDPEHVLVGHGEGLHGPEAAEQLRRALFRSRLTFFTWAAMLPFRARK